jgi:hypothetical protein
MDILESFGWIVLGFVPTICALTMAWKVGSQKIQYKRERKKVSTNVRQ